MESNLPFFFLVFPPFFKARFPELVANARGNAHRLVTAYDIHKTLQHLLHLQTRSTPWSNEDAARDSSPKTPTKSYSFLTPIPASRSCGNSGIPSRFCSCSKIEEINVNTTIVLRAAEAVVAKINEALEPVTDICIKWHLEKVVEAKKRRGKQEYSVLVETKPKAQFLGWVQRKNGKLTLGIGQVSRVDKYGLTSLCVLKRDFGLRPFCLCKMVN